MQNYEKLAAFYLGRTVDPQTGETTDQNLLYDDRDLTTQAMCVGMTGSGKTGLCLSLLEEAAIEGIPVLAIDPKGDLGNLRLTFPDLRPKDFAPWVDSGEAMRNGMDPAADARHVAGRASKEKGDIGRAQAKLESLQQQLEDMEDEFSEETERLRDSWSSDALESTRKEVRPRKSDIAIGRVVLVWTPWQIGENGVSAPSTRSETSFFLVRI